MRKLIFTRQGALAYAAAPPALFLLFLVSMAFMTPGPFTIGSPVEYLPQLLIPMALMAFALPALCVLTRWCAMRLCGGHAPAGVQVLLIIPAAVLMWIPSAVVSIPLWLLNLVWLMQGRYPTGRPLRWQPVAVLVAVVFLIGGIGTAMEQHRRSQPAATPSDAFHVYAPDAAILAEIPQGEDTVLIISASGSGLSVLEADGWHFRVPYENRLEVLEGTAATLKICHNPAGEEDVVILQAVRMDRDAPLQPCDTAGSLFTEFTTDLGIAASMTWYAIVDADAPGYAVTLE